MDFSDYVAGFRRQAFGGASFSRFLDDSMIARDKSFRVLEFFG
jgi:hypothetical protein